MMRRFTSSAEPLVAALGVHVDQSLGRLAPVAETDPVVAGKVRTRLGGGDQVVGGNRIVEGRQRYLHELGAEPFVCRNCLVHRLLHVRVEPGDEALFRKPDLHPFDIVHQGLRVVGNRQVDAGGIAGVIAGHGAQHDGAVGHVAGNRPHLVERGGIGDHPVAGDPAIGRLEPHAAAVGGGLADGTAGVGAEGGNRLPGGDCRGRAAGRAAGDALQVPGVAGRAEMAALAWRNPWRIRPGSAFPEARRPAPSVSASWWRRKGG